MNSIVPMIEAKKELKRIDIELDNPVLLIGGLAVNQFVEHRVSEDLDLVLDYEISKALLENIYPSVDWIVEEKNNSDIRPSYEISSRVHRKLIVKFGPKILEREPYPYINYFDLLEDTLPFKVDGSELANIRVPTATALSYTKLISYGGRKDLNSDKALQDLKDFVDLTNHQSWNPSDFWSTVRRMGAAPHIQELSAFSDSEQEILKNSNLFRTLGVFSNEFQKVKKMVALERRESRVRLAISSGTLIEDRPELVGKYKLGVVAFDMVGFCTSERRNTVISAIPSMIREFAENFRYRSLGDTYVVYLPVKTTCDIRSYAITIHEKLNGKPWHVFGEDVYSHAISTYGIRADNEEIEMLLMRHFDSLLSQKEENVVFRKAADSVSRTSIPIVDMVNYNE